MMTNIFWADARSVLDYDYFGDVICFDTTYKTNSYGRPFAVFVGVNHHKQTVVFGVALLYDETSATFEWLFETFKTAMSGKEPKTILTDQCAAIISAIGTIFSNTIHRLCVWHMYQNAAKHLSHVFQGSKTFKKDFGKCVFYFEEVDEFIAAWNDMLKKYNLEDNEWLHRLFQSKEKWALVYGQQTFCADMISTQRSESLNAMLKRYLHVRLDLLDFFKHYERAVDDRRHAEVESDFYASQTSPKVPRVRMLIQTSKEYTPAMFEIFRGEYDMAMRCCLYNSGHSDSTSEFKVSNSDHPRSHKWTVKFDPNGSKVSCSCKKFEFVRVLCHHALKVLDHNNIKELAPEYILKRWTRHAKKGPSQAIQKCANDEETRVVLARWYGSLCRSYNNILSKAAENEEAYALLQSASLELMEKVDQIMHGNQSKDMPPDCEQAEKQPVEFNKENEVQVQGIKRKEAGSSSKRNKSGLEQNIRNKPKKGQATMYKNCDCASASLEANPSFAMSNENYNLQAFQRAMPQFLQCENYNLQAFPHAMSPLPQAMPPIPRAMPPIPQVENYNLQVLQRTMPPLPTTNATFQQLLGLQPQQPHSYYNTQPSQSSSSIVYPDLGWATYQNDQLPSKVFGNQSSHQQDNPV
ncbi:hypothetical protein ACQ4PT_017496 [Festuca glaucescens]